MLQNLSSAAFVIDALRAKTYLRHCVVSLKKPLFPLLKIDSTKEDRK